MKLSIDEQKKFLAERLEIEPLRQAESNQEEIKSFVQAAKGDRISDYLINHAWCDDGTRDTKVFLIRDSVTKEIAFFFAINCGILFSELNIWNIGEKEKPAFDKYVTAVLKLKSPGLNETETDKANALYDEALGEMWECIKDPDRVSCLLSLADEKVQMLEEKREALSETGEADHVQQVQETFPAIDIKFFGRNKNYQPVVDLDFKLGVYVFWEMLVPHLLEIAEKVGCKYIYLFAADNTENEKIQEAPLWTQDYDPDDEEEELEDEELHKLVNYYINELKFRYVSKYKILKPHYERRCYTLVQEVDNLQANRELVWQSHMVDETRNM